MIVVFDLDGTLVDASRLHSKILKEVMNEDIPPEKIYDSSSLSFLLMKNLPRNKWRSIKDITRLHEAEMIKQISLVEPRKGVYDMLKKVKCKKAIFTSANKKLCDAMLEHCFLNGYFDMIITSSDVFRTKPDAEALYKISDKLDDDKLVCIGNSEKDMLAAKKFGAVSVLFDPKGTSRAFSDFRIKQIDEVFPLIESLSD